MILYRQRRMAQAQDKRVSKLTGLKIQINSGAVNGRKGDLYGKHILVETKTSSQPKKTISVKRLWLDEISSKAFSMGKRFWALVIGDELTKEDFVIMPLDLFDTLCNSYDQEMMLNEDKS
jgi:hypothetical protein